jgi:hypothetical protein
LASGRKLPSRSQIRIAALSSTATGGRFPTDGEGEGDSDRDVDSGRAGEDRGEGAGATTVTLERLSAGS